MPRDYQRPLWDYLERGGKRAIALWHRRAGKDDLILHRTAVAMIERPASYWHMLPEFSQARRALWTAVNPRTGKRRIDEAFPPDLRENASEQEMFIRLKNGSTWQLVGSDRYNSLVGAGVAGVTFSEWALGNPSAWGYIRPMIIENNGWATFITTPRGRNHAHAMYQMAQGDPEWFSQRLTIHDTRALTDEQVAESLREYIALYGEDVGRAQFEQEYECSFNAAILGAYYAHEMVAVRSEGRIVHDLMAVDAPVHRAWDIGVSDDTSIWWFQVVGGQLWVLDCYTQSGAGVEHYADVIAQRASEHGWRDGTDFVPHDARVREWGTGRTRVETMQALGLNPMVVPAASLADGIQAARRTLPRAVFHSRCEEVGLSALEQYRRVWDDERKAYRAAPLHDWTSHIADAWRYLSLAWRTIRPEPMHVPEPEGWRPPKRHDRKDGRILI